MQQAVVLNVLEDDYRLALQLVQVFDDVQDFLKASGCAHSVEQLFGDALE